MADPSKQPPPSDVEALLSLLSRPLSEAPESDLIALRGHLGGLLAASLPPEQRAQITDVLYARTLTAATTLMPRLHDSRLAGPSATKRIARTLQDALLATAENYLALHTSHPEASGLAADQMLWRALRMLAMHLLLGCLAAAPAGLGVWRQLHRAWQRAEAVGVADNTPLGGTSLRREYLASLLLGMAQTTSMSSRQVVLAADYAHRFGLAATLTRQPVTTEPNTLFWVDPGRDGGPVAAVRRPPPDEPVLWIDASRLAALAQRHLDAIIHGAPPRSLDLPDFAATPAGRLALSRLIAAWGTPLRRRFPRRKKHYRAELVTGLANVRRLLGTTASDVECGQWMIVNESAEGYAAMHIAGRTDALQVGDVVGLRPDGASVWQICIVRRAFSESPVHVELGLQLMAPNGEAVTVATPPHPREPALLLPAIPPLRHNAALIVAAGSLDLAAEHVIVARDDHTTPVSARLDSVAEHTGKIDIVDLLIDTPDD